MDTGKIQIKVALLSKRIELRRIETKTSKGDLCKAMEIDRSSYSRKLNSFNGFTDLELCRAMAYLGLTVYVSDKPIEDILHACNILGKQSLIDTNL